MKGTYEKYVVLQMMSFGVLWTYFGHTLEYVGHMVECFGHTLDDLG